MHRFSAQGEGRLAAASQRNDSPRKGDPRSVTPPGAATRRAKAILASVAHLSAAIRRAEAIAASVVRLDVAARPARMSGDQARRHLRAAIPALVVRRKKSRPPAQAALPSAVLPVSAAKANSRRARQSRRPRRAA